MRIHLLGKVFLKNAEDHELILKKVQVCHGMRFSLEFSGIFVGITSRLV